MSRLGQTTSDPLLAVVSDKRRAHKKARQFYTRCDQLFGWMQWLTTSVLALLVTLPTIGAWLGFANSLVQSFVRQASAVQKAAVHQAAYSELGDLMLELKQAHVSREITESKYNSWVKTAPDLPFFAKVRRSASAYSKRRTRFDLATDDSHSEPETFHEQLITPTHNVPDLSAPQTPEAVGQTDP